MWDLWWTGFLWLLWFPLQIFIPPTAWYSPSSIIWGWYNRPVVAAVPNGLSLTPLRIIKNNTVQLLSERSWRHAAQCNTAASPLWSWSTRHLPGATEENHKNLSQDGQFPSHPLNISQACYCLSPLTESKYGSQSAKKVMEKPAVSQTNLLFLSIMQL
jgi:hypothetical protein